MNLIEAAGVGRVFPVAGGEFRALNNINVEIPEGKLTILKGRSGSGKTTLMNILGALDYPTEGKVMFDGEDITSLGDSERTLLRRHKIGYVFQSVALIPMMTAEENVEFALRMAGMKEGAEEEGGETRRERALRCLHLVGLSGRAGHMPQEMSGGEQQRVAIARAIAHRPKILFADEPTGALDTMNGLAVVKLFRELTDEEGVTVLMTTHDPGLMTIGDKVYELEGGELIGG